MAIKLLASACSDKGCVRKNNEDSFCLNGHYLPREKMDDGGLFKCKAEPYALFAVCDGMGGAEFGEEASLLSVMRCSASLSAKEDLFDREKLIYFLRDGCQAVYDQARQRGNRSGATMALLVAGQDRLRIANMGDSRIYRLHKGAMQQISLDHTEMQRLLNAGLIKPEEVKTHPKRHMILQYWGMPLDRAPLTPDISKSIPYEDGDRYLLCSDGLTDMLTDKQIAALLSKNDPVEKISEQMVRQAKAHGGRDNVTVVVMEVKVTADEKTAAKKQPKKQGKQLQSMRGLLSAIAVLLGAVNVYLLMEWLDFFLFR